MNNIKFILWIYIIFLTVSGLLKGEKIYVLPDAIHPKSINIYENRLYLTEDPSIYIYSLDDFKLVKKFGKRGEGPAEMLSMPHVRTVFVSFSPEHIVVSSRRKISFFSYNGDYIGEMRHNVWYGLAPIYALGSKYVGMEAQFSKKKQTGYINLYDEKCKKIKELAIDEGSDEVNFYQNFALTICGQKLLIVQSEDFIIDVFNDSGKLLNQIQKDYKRKRVTQEDKDAIVNQLKKVKLYSALKDQLVYPEFLPAIKKVFADASNLYVITYKSKEGKSECWVLDWQGKKINEFFLPIKNDDQSVDDTLYTIYNDKLYELVDDIDKGTWNLHISELEN